MSSGESSAELSSSEVDLLRVRIRKRIRGDSVQWHGKAFSAWGAELASEELSGLLDGHESEVAALKRLDLCGNRLSTFSFVLACTNLVELNISYNGLLSLFTFGAYKSGMGFS